TFRFIHIREEISTNVKTKELSEPELISIQEQKVTLYENNVAYLRCLVFCHLTIPDENFAPSQNAERELKENT
ncbi:hypothetical protein C0J52_13009, partial [Blattella germanica]